MKNQIKTINPNRRKFLKFILAIIGVLGIRKIFGSKLIESSSAGWTEPGVLPPGANVPLPINVGPVAQTKEGDLTINGTLHATHRLRIPVGPPGV